MHSILALGAGLGVCMVAGLAAVKWQAGGSSIVLGICCVVTLGVVVAIKTSSDSDWN